MAFFKQHCLNCSIFILLAAAMGGCSIAETLNLPSSEDLSRWGDLKPDPSGSLLEMLAPPSPAQAAEWAVDSTNADNRYRGTILLGMENFGGEDLYMALFADNSDDPDPNVRTAAVRALGNHGRPEHVPVILARLEDESHTVRAEAARALQRVHNPIAVEPLLLAVEVESEPDSDVRAESAHALGQYAQRGVIDGLIGALADPSLLVNRQALASLTTLTGQDFGTDRRAWLDWQASEADPFAGRRQYVFPVFHRERRFYEFLPFLPQPANEAGASPAGSPATQDG